MESIDIAWAAGLFEGEGSICVFQQKHNVLPLIRLQIVMTDKDVLERFCSIVECGRVSDEHRYGRPRLDGGPRKPTFVWQIGNRADVERILMAFKPWLGVRRTAKTEEALAEIAKLNFTCVYCNGNFRAHRLTARFCGWPCRNRWNYLNRRPSDRPSQIGRPRVLEGLQEAG